MSTELVIRASRGDRDAYEQLARGVASRLFAIASAILHDKDSAEDAVQQTLVDIWRDLRALRDPAKFEAWTYRIVVRHCRAESRRARRLSGHVHDVSELLSDQTDDVSAVAERDALAGSFRRLSTDHRTVLVLHFLVGLPLQDIAEILGVPFGTVGSRLHAAKRNLRAALDEGAGWPARERLA